MEEKKIRVAITQGDTNGVGYEVILKCFEAPEMMELCTPIVYGNPRIASYHRKSLANSMGEEGGVQDVMFHTIRKAEEAEEGKLNLVVVDEEEVPVSLGHESTQAGQQALGSLEAALADCREGKADVLVTAPINKHSMQGEGFTFPGHTEYLEAAFGQGTHSLMILLNTRLRVALATTHLPLSAVPEALTTGLLTDKLTLLNQSLMRDFGIDEPRIAVLALNPHAGDGGTLGTEEKDIIAPAVSKAYTELGIKAFGPYPADGFFGSAAYVHYDAVLAMYHDQGLAPLKALGMDEGVNFTAGLPLVRTSPDHGTAYDIAGKGTASEASMRQAIYTAIDVLRCRRTYDLAHLNPLAHLYRSPREDERRARRAASSPQTKEVKSFAPREATSPHETTSPHEATSPHETTLPHHEDAPSPLSEPRVEHPDTTIADGEQQS